VRQPPNNPHEGRFTDTFLIVTPGITIEDRLRVLLPGDPESTEIALRTCPARFGENARQMHGWRHPKNDVGDPSFFGRLDSDESSTDVVVLRSIYNVGNGASVFRSGGVTWLKPLQLQLSRFSLR
jgi:hypothetical protein